MTQTPSQLDIDDKLMTRQEDGSLTSYFEILGVAFQPNRESVNKLLDDIYEALPFVLARTGVRLDFLFISQSEQSQPTTLVDGKGDPELISHIRKTIDALVEPTVPVPDCAERCLLAFTTKIPRHWEQGVESGWHHDHVNYLVGNTFRELLIRKSPASDYLAERERQVQPLDVHPQRSSAAGTFSGLMRELGRKIPWRMSLSIVAGHDEARQQLLRSTRLARWTGSLIKRDLLQASDRDLVDNLYGDQVLVQARLDFQTWGCSAEKTSSHKKALESLLWRCDMPALGEWRVMDAAQALTLMPITRPGSPWKAGEDTVNFRTPDGKLYPYAPYKRFQRLYNELVIDSFGAAIETYHRSINRAILGSPSDMPRLGRITVGAVKPAPDLDTVLTPADSTLEQRFTLPLHAAVNLFDTPLGIQQPTSEQFEDIGCLVQILCNAEDYPESFFYELTQLATQKTYERLSELHRPKAYVPALDGQIDEALGRLSAVNVFSWWEVVSLLHEAGENALAQKAQAFAVPQLKDLVETLQTDQQIRDVFGYRFDCTGRSRLECAAERLLDVLAQWPALSKPTGLNLEPWRITTLHIDTQLTIPSLRTSQSTAVQYLLARKLLTPGFFTSFEVLYGQDSKAFKDYHAHHYEQEFAIARKICYSDLHQLIDCVALKRRLMIDLRESRKAGVMVTFDTNTFAGIDNHMLQMVTSQVILEPQRMSSTEKEKMFSFDYTFRGHEFDLHPPGKDIALLFKAYLCGSPYTLAQLLILPVSARQAS
jgi:hypothetical protein